MGAADNQLKKRAVSKSKHYMSCKINAAATINALHHETMDIDTLISELLVSFNRVKKGNLLEVEAILLSQAQTLNVFFHKCLSQVSDLDMVNHFQVFSDLAMKAQNNCRKTLLTLAEIKNPKQPTFIKQQNYAIGNQQVNNNSENLKNNSNEVLCEVQHAKLDDRSTEKTITINPSLAALETSNRSQNT